MQMRPAGHAGISDLPDLLATSYGRTDGFRRHGPDLHVPIQRPHPTGVIHDHIIGVTRVRAQRTIAPTILFGRECSDGGAINRGVTRRAKIRSDVAIVGFGLALPIADPPRPGMVVVIMPNRIRGQWQTEKHGVRTGRKSQKSAAQEAGSRPLDDRFLFHGFDVFCWFWFLVLFRVNFRQWFGWFHRPASGD